MTAPRVQGFNPADLWESLVDSGMSEADATAEVQRRMQGSERPDFSNVESGSASMAASDPTRDAIVGGYKKAGRLVGRAANSALFGFGDEIAGAVTAAMAPRPGTYTRNRDAVRDQLEQARRDNPKLSVVADIGGAVMSPLSRALIAAKSTTLPRTMLSAARGGATGGALYGAGRADDGLGDRLGGAAGGAALGGIAGGLTPAIGAGIRAVARTPRAIYRAVTADPVSSGAAPTTPEAIKAATSATDKAREYVVRALERDKVPLNEIGEGGADDMLFNLGGRSAGMATRVAQAVPSEATDAVPRAIYGQLEQGPERLLRGVEKAIGKPIPNPLTRVDELADDAARAAKPHYDAIRNEFVRSEALDKIMGRPAIKSAITTARTNLLNSGEAVPDGVTVGLADDVKKILDDEIESIGEKITKGMASGADKSRVQSLEKARDALVGELDNLTGGEGGRYAEARRVAQQGISKREAFREGTKYSTARRDRLEAEMPGMTPENQAAYREGAATSIENVVKATPDRRNLATRLFGSDAEREKLRTAFQGDPGALKAIEDAFKREDRFRQQATSALAPGQSITTPLREAVEEFRGNLFEDMAKSGIWSAARRRAVEAYTRGARGLDEQAAAEVGRLMTSRPNQALMRELLAARSDALRRAGVRAGRGARVGMGSVAATNRQR
jgi:hypothetical protein